MLNSLRYAVLVKFWYLLTPRLKARAFLLHYSGLYPDVTVQELARLGNESPSDYAEWADTIQDRADRAKLPTTLHVVR